MAQPDTGSTDWEHARPMLRAVTSVDAGQTRDLSGQLADLQHAASALLCDGDSAGTAVVALFRDLLQQLSAASTEHESVSRIGLLEEIKSAAAAAQAREAVAFDETRRAREAAEGVPATARGRGVANEIALARGESPTRGSNALTVARILDADMPQALHALSTGKLSEWSATLLVKEVVTLASTGRSAVDHELADRYGKASIGRLTSEARALANQVDPHARLKRHMKAASERRVTVRPAPHDMAYLTALLPVPQAFACRKSLRESAATYTYERDTVPRSGAQIEADLLVERLTGQSRADAVPVEVHLVMTDASLFGVTRADAQMATARPVIAGEAERGAFPIVDDDGRRADPRHVSAWIPGYGPLSAAIARDLLDPTHDLDGPVMAAPVTGGPATSSAVATGSDSSSPGPHRSGAARPDSIENQKQPPDRGGGTQRVRERDPGSSARPSPVPPQPTGKLPQSPENSQTTSIGDSRVRDESQIGRGQPRRTDTGREATPQKSLKSPERVFLRRILLDPVTGEIAAMDTRRRAFTGTLRRALILRDDRCRTPWCGAPIVHLDHTHPFARGGTTRVTNGTGLCARCNYVKENHGWKHQTDGSHSEPGAITITAPTGHTYRSAPPPLLPTFSALHSLRAHQAPSNQ